MKNKLSRWILPSLNKYSLSYQLIKFIITIKDEIMCSQFNFCPPFEDTLLSPTTSDITFRPGIQYKGYSTLPTTWIPDRWPQWFILCKEHKRIFLVAMDSSSLSLRSPGNLILTGTDNSILLDVILSSFLTFRRPCFGCCFPWKWPQLFYHSYKEAPCILLVRQDTDTKEVEKCFTNSFCECDTFRTIYVQ